MEVSAEAHPYLQLARHITHLSRAIRRRIDPLLREQLGITALELSVLRSVETGNCNPMRVAERLDIPPSTASRIFDRLVELELVDRTGDPEDRRKARLSLTAGGHDAADQARQLLVEAMRTAYHDVPAADIDHATQVLAGLLRHAETDTVDD